MEDLVQIRVKPEVRKRLKLLAVAQGKDLPTVVEEMVKKFLSDKSWKPQKVTSPQRW